jgi:hypothetical protein
MAGNLMEMPSMWDTYSKYQDIKGRAQNAEREFVGDKTAPESSTEVARFVGTGVKRKVRKSLTPHLDKLGNQFKSPTPQRKMLPSPDGGILGLDTPSTAELKPATHMSFGAKLGTVGKAAALSYGAGLDRVKRGFQDRMSAYNVYESEEPLAQPAPKKDATSPIPSTSSLADRKSTSPAGKLRPSGKGVNKGLKPETTQGPKKPKKDPGIAAQEKAAKSGASQLEQQQTPDPETVLRGRASEFRSRLSSISMVKSPASPALAPVGKKPQTAKESVSGFLRGLISLREAEVTKWPKSERAVAKLLKSKANIGLRKGTPLKHTFRSNDGQHQYSGRELSMRQKIIAEHRRKNFPLPKNFENMSGRDIGAEFDKLSDRGMLEERPNLDPSTINYFRRRVTRVGSRLGRKVKSFLSGVATSPKKTKESETTDAPLIENTTPFCQFSVGNVKYPEECGCPECATLIETAGTTFGQNLRPGNIDEAEIYEDVQKKKSAIKRLLNKRRTKKRKRVREAYEDIGRVVTRDMNLHRRSPEPISLTRRPNSYFQSSSTLRKLDRLGMFLAKTALVAHGLSPMAQSLMWQYKDASPQFWADTRRAASAIKDSLVGKSRNRVFRGHPVSESGSFRDEVEQGSKAYSSKYPRLGEFVDKPVDTVKNATHALTTRLVRRAGEKMGSDTLKRHAYPIGKAIGYSGLALGAYGAKKLIYDPIRQKLEKARLKKSQKSDDNI